MLTAVIGTIITLTMLAHHRNKKSNKTRKLQLNFEFNFYIELIFTLYYRSTKSWDGSTIGSKKAPKHEKQYSKTVGGFPIGIETKISKLKLA